MAASFIKIDYQKTGYFSQIVSDYLEAKPNLRPFYEHLPNINGIKSAIENRKSFNTDRANLVKGLQKQYEGLPLSEKQITNLELLLQENTFTITTAHQPNIFTGPLYFIYKILHAIKMADDLKNEMPENNFVPVYFMGSEDADLDELGYIYLAGEKLVWQTNQTGAVGRMMVDDNLTKLINKISGTIGNQEFGGNLVSLVKRCYSIGKTIQQATLELVNSLFAHYGLLVLIPDNEIFKTAFKDILKKEISTQFSSKALQFTVNELNEKHYKVQTAGRNINLFYLYENIRERIEAVGENFEVKNASKSFNFYEIFAKIDKNPQNFSPNVVLRPVFQELILPNIAFIGGGGELAYWLELKQVFREAKVPYPVLFLRNSFLLVDEKSDKNIHKLQFSYDEIFQSSFELSNQYIGRLESNLFSIQNEKTEILKAYDFINQKLVNLDKSLSQHTSALQQKTLIKLIALEKKILKAQKRKHQEAILQIESLKQKLFPQNNLQERIENFSEYYSKFGNDWLNEIYNASGSFEMKFTVIK